MDKKGIIDGLERMYSRIHYTQKLLRSNNTDKAIDSIKNICLDSKYCLKHIRALKRSLKKRKEIKLNGTSTRRKAKTTKRISAKRKLKKSPLKSGSLKTRRKRPL